MVLHRHKVPHLVSLPDLRFFWQRGSSQHGEGSSLLRPLFEPVDRPRRVCGAFPRQDVCHVADQPHETLVQTLNQAGDPNPRHTNAPTRHSTWHRSGLGIPYQECSSGSLFSDTRCCRAVCVHTVVPSSALCNFPQPQQNCDGLPSRSCQPWRAEYLDK